MQARKRILWIGIILCLSTALGVAQEERTLNIQVIDIKRNVHKNFLGVPRDVDCTIYWEVYEKKESEWQKLEEELFDHFEVLSIEKDESISIANSGEIAGNYYTFEKQDVGKRFGYVVKGYSGRRAVSVSDTVWAVTGKMRADAETSAIKWYHWIPFNGRIPLALINRAKFYDGSTNAGKIAFHLIWNFFLIGSIIWFIFCLPNLSLQKVFPLKKGFNLGKGYDEIYRRYESPEFRNILEEWRDIIQRGNENIRQELEQGEKISISEIAAVNTKFWRDRGANAIRNLIRRISLPSMNQYPAARIIRAGLENHELGGFHWMEVSKEVDRAIENRASSELEQLRRKSLVDWLWNLGTLAPLVGLFGTATGISHAFAMLMLLRTDITQTELVKRLAGGIYEALWTTIEGLAVGITFTLLYYYYQNKLTWIYSKWEELYVYVAEKL